MKLGARILKTGIAITLALWLATLLNLPSPVFAGISAIFAIQPTIYRSYLSIIEQIQANIIGASIAILFGLIFGPHPFVIGFTAVIVIALNIRLKLQNTIPVSLVTVIAILESPGEHFIEFSLIRFATIILGVLAAFIVNMVFIPPKYETKLYHRIVENTEEIIKWIRINSRHISEHSVLKDDIEKFKDNIIKLDQLYLHYKEERSYFKKNTLAKTRKLVIFRQLLNTTRRALDMLKRLHRLENEFHHMPKEFQQIFIAELDYLLNYHETILLKFIGKIKPSVPDEFMQEGALNKSELFESFLRLKAEYEDENYVYNILPLVTSIMDYSEHLEHLDVLMNSFQTYHKEENELDIPEAK
ncbi:aromatic acid exporter family protein [Bacillus lacus]|uniref:Aromatic acid exporter family protein n=1 Tax=Metabacillus lacus TaxID=1983721 RepID=A0A7X2J1J6_9BACI|nr:aromatic acid exporter family protein [Metabacillus lacus]MRX73756.1 aromatic acid exporter family protein [Metabacillus lacus]